MLAVYNFLDEAALQVARILLPHLETDIQWEGETVRVKIWIDLH